MDFFNARKVWITLMATTSACVLCTAGTRSARAAEYTFDDGVTIQFQNTFQYSALERTAPVSPYIGNNPNTNDGDNNLRSGIVSNRFDLLSKFDISDAGYGFDVSVDSFYDTVYNQKTQQSPGSATYNPAQQPSNKFTNATEVQAGRDIQLRNLFLYGSHDIAGIPVTIRVGRLVNLFGESLLFALNGISYGQAPIDVERAASVPNTQAKDLFLPVGQVDISAQLTDSISATGYYQFEAEKFNLSPAGSYFSISDILDEGGQRLIYFPSAAPQSGAPGGYIYRSKDESAASTGQFGIALHYDPTDAPVDFGLYALQYNDSEPQVYIRNYADGPRFIAGSPNVPGLNTPNALNYGTYQLVYPDGIQIYGASASATAGPANFAGEISARTNEPLVSTVEVPSGTFANNSSHPLYATGNVLHYQASMIYLGKATRFWDDSTVLFEGAGNNLLGFLKNRENFSGGAHMALGVRAIAQVSYYEVFSGLDLTPNIGLGWNFMGHSPDTLSFNNTGIDRGGDLTVGLSFLYFAKWSGGISYTRYIARPSGPPYNTPNRDPFADRDFAGFNVERTF